MCKDVYAAKEGIRVCVFKASNEELLKRQTCDRAEGLDSQNAGSESNVGGLRPFGRSANFRSWEGEAKPGKR